LVGRPGCENAAVSARRDLRREEGRTVWLYVLSHAHGAKPGITRASDLEERRAEVERAAGLPIELVAGWRFEDRYDARFVEGQALALLREHRTFGEWHSCDAATVIAALERAMEESGMRGERLAVLPERRPARPRGRAW
jgi:hypothetical protein